MWRTPGNAARALGTRHMCGTAQTKPTVLKDNGTQFLGTARTDRKLNAYGGYCAGGQARGASSGLEHGLRKTVLSTKVATG